MVEYPADGTVHALQSKIANILDEVAVGQHEKLREWVNSSIPMLGQRDLNLLHLLCKDLSRALGVLGND